MLVLGQPPSALLYVMPSLALCVALSPALKAKTDYPLNAGNQYVMVTRAMRIARKLNSNLKNNFDNGD